MNRPTKLQLVREVIAKLYDMKLDPDKAIRMFSYFDYVDVMFSYFDYVDVMFAMDECYRANKDLDSCMKALNRRVRWSTIERDVVENFHANVHAAIGM